MKKFVCGILVGAVLAVGGTAFADSVNLAGKKVQGVYAIEKNGKKMAEAAIIDGAAYAPVRVVVEATGTTLSVEGKKIIMGQTTNSVSENSTVTKQQELFSLSKEVESLEREIKITEDTIKATREISIPGLEESLSFAQSDEAKTRWRERIKQEQSNLAAAEALLPKLKQQLADLEAKIAELTKN